MLIEDKVKGAFKTATSYFHFHPDIKIIDVGIGAWKLNLPKCNKYI